MRSSTAIAVFGSLASASVLPRQDTAPSSFKLQSRLANGTSMGYFTPVVGGGGWYSALVDDVSEAKSLVLTEPSPQNGSLVVPKDPSDGLDWNIGWIIGGYESDYIQWVGLARKEDGAVWTIGFSIDGDDDNLLKYDGPESPLIFGACPNIGLYVGSGLQTALYWRLPGSKGSSQDGCADLSLHAVFD